jgi:hypothetical protein
MLGDNKAPETWKASEFRGRRNGGKITGYSHNELRNLHHNFMEVYGYARQKAPECTNEEQNSIGVGGKKWHPQ